MAEVTCMKRGKKWQYRFEGASINGKRQRFSKGGFPTKKEAQEAGNKAMAEYNNSGLSFVPSEISFSDYLDYWLKEYCQINLKEGTCSGYKKKINNHIRPALGKYRLKSLTPAILQQFINEKFNQGYSRNTLVDFKSILSGSLSYATDTVKFIKTNPIHGVKIPSPRAKAQTPTRKKVREIVTPDQWRAIIQRFPYGHSCYIPLLLAYRCGLRLGEAFAVDRKRDIDLEKSTLAVNRQVQWLNGHWTFTDPKYDSFRVIKLDKYMLAELKKVIERQEKAEIFYAEYYIHLYENPQRQLVTEKGEGCREIHMLNVRENGTYIQPRVMMHCGRVIHYDLGFKNYDYHSLRYTHTTMLIERGAYPKDVQIRLGHKDLRVTLEIYTHLTEKMQNQSIELMNTIPLAGVGDSTPFLMQTGTQTPEDIMNSIEFYPEINPQEPSIHAGSEALVPELRVQTCTLPENLGYKMGTKGTILSFESNFEIKTTSKLVVCTAPRRGYYGLSP